MGYKHNNYYKYIIIFILILILLFILSKFISLFKNKSSIRESYTNLNDRIKAFYINLDKNVTRNNMLIESYQKSDLKEIPLTRFSAVKGDEVDFEKWLSPEALKELKIIDKTKTRTHHYQLTKGGVGCFLSHYTLAKKLLADNKTEYYVIFEDDIMFNENCLSGIKHYMSIAPEDWDAIFISVLRKTQPVKKGEFYTLNGFWGTQSYIINKKYARKLIKEVEQNQIDGQIDAYLSRMIQQNKMNLYFTEDKLIKNNELTNSTDIQCKLIKKSPLDNPFNYKGYLV